MEGAYWKIRLENQLYFFAESYVINVDINPQPGNPTLVYMVLYKFRKYQTSHNNLSNGTNYRIFHKKKKPTYE